MVEGEPAEGARDHAGDKKSNVDAFVDDVAGELLLFPSAVDHAVTDNGSGDDLRLSIAFDLVLSAPPASASAAAPPEYLAPHPSQWDPLRQDGPLSN